MLRMFAGLSLAVLFLAVARTAPIPKRGADNYLPTVLGTVLVYECTSPDPKGKLEKRKLTTVVKDVGKASGGLFVVLSHDEEGSPNVGTDTYLISDKGISTTATSVTGPEIKGEQVIKFDPPTLLLRLPHREGAKWETIWPNQPDVKGEKAINTAHGPEEVEVPAGKFKAIRVEFRGTSNGKPATSTFWYAPDIGLVKYKTGDGVVQELKSFKIGK